MVDQLGSFGPTQILQLLGSIGTNEPDQFAALLADAGFRPPPPQIAPLGELAQPQLPQPVPISSPSQPPVGLTPLTVQLPRPGPIAPGGPPIAGPIQPPTLPAPGPGAVDPFGGLEGLFGPGPGGAAPEVEAGRGPGDFLKALSAVQIPQAQQIQPQRLSPAVPRGGGQIDPGQLAALLQLLGAGQGAGAAPVPALGGLIAGGRR